MINKNHSKTQSGKIISIWVMLTLAVCLMAFLVPYLDGIHMPEDAKPVVVLLDPGHGGEDPGAISQDGTVVEAHVNLAIALACYEELQQYDGVKVYLTRREMADTDEKLSLEARVDMVEEYGADILVSIHCNDAESDTANGIEVFVSHSIYKREYNQRSTLLAVDMLQRFRDMGITIRGVKQRLSEGEEMKIYNHPDGTQETGDYFAVIGNSIGRFGIPGILVEHGFVDGDKQYLTDPEWIAAFGKSDAEAIAESFGLKRRDVTVTDVPPEAEILSDSDVRESANVTALIVSLPFEIQQKHEERLLNVWQGYESLSATGRRLVGEKYQSEIDEVYKLLIEFDAQDHPIRLEEKDSAQGIDVNRIGKFVRLNMGETPSGLKRKLKWQIDSGTPSDLHIETVAKQGEVTDKLATGCIVELLDGTLLLDTLLCVIPGDIDGNGLITEDDQALLEAYLDGRGAEISLDAASLFACDITGDGRIDSHDLAAIENLLY